MLIGARTFHLPLSTWQLSRRPSTKRRARCHKWRPDTRIRLRDQERLPSAPDLKRVLRQMAAVATFFFPIGGGGWRHPCFVSFISLSAKAGSSWALVYADGSLLLQGGHGFTVGLLSKLWFLVLLGMPIIWRKVAGGDENAWVGYSVQVREHKPSRTASRCLGWSISALAWSNPG